MAKLSLNRSSKSQSSGLWLFHFGAGRRLNPDQKIRHSVVLKAHSLLLRLHPLASAPSNGAQLPGAHAQRAGARRDAVAGAQAMCKGCGRTHAKDNVQGMRWKWVLLLAGNHVW